MNWNILKYGNLSMKYCILIILENSHGIDLRKVSRFKNGI